MERLLKWAAVWMLFLGPGLLGCQANLTPATQAGVPRLLELATTTCPHCWMMNPVMEQLQSEYGARLNVEVVEVDKDAAMAAKYPTNAVPVQIFLAPSGRELYRHVGEWSKSAIVKKWKELGYDLNARPSQATGRTRM